MRIFWILHYRLTSQKAYGVANVELNVPMRMDDAFLVLSITKVFVATAAFLLVEDGKLHLDDKITQIIPELPIAGAKSPCSIALVTPVGFRISCDTGPADPSGWQIRRNMH
jgi:CubicO group peptidase (beta-lactamase class C family)